MSFPGSRFFKHWSALRRLKKLTREQRSIVFYAEDASSWPHLGTLVEEIRGSGRELCYVTSSEDDPILGRGDDGCHAFCVGEGTIRTLFFSALECDVCVMTMPDLERFHIKRSKAHPVHYVYVFHSIVSTHMIYRPRAFDDYDSVLCVGPHHVAEIRANEAADSLSEKQLVEYGYPRLDSILREVSQRPRKSVRAEGEKIRVLIAPSWGPQGILETIGAELVRILLSGGFHVTVRPHPVTRKKWPEKIEALREYATRDDFLLEENIVSQESLHACDLMVSDWSGVAYEFAFGLERPVLFIDVPRKVNSPDYEKIACEPIEVSVRTEIGQLIGPGELASVPDIIRELCEDPSAFAQTIRDARTKYVFNVGEASGGADHILRVAQERRSGKSQSPPKGGETLGKSKVLETSVIPEERRNGRALWSPRP